MIPAKRGSGRPWRSRAGAIGVLTATLMTLAARGLDSRPPELNAAALAYKLPQDIHWEDLSSGARIAKLVGDPDKPGLYIIYYEWTAHHMSHPHFHPHDRFISVLSGTWWVGTGKTFDPGSTVPMPTGTFVTHYANQIHYDGAKDADVVLEIVGEGPATAVPAEEK